jgi:hypothetical protein
LHNRENLRITLSGRSCYRDREEWMHSLEKEGGFIFATQVVDFHLKAMLDSDFVTYCRKKSTPDLIVIDRLGLDLQFFGLFYVNNIPMIFMAD